MVFHGQFFIETGTGQGSTKQNSDPPCSRCSSATKGSRPEDPQCQNSLEEFVNFNHIVIIHFMMISQFVK